MTFKQARRQMPRCVEGNVDPLAHMTIQDLAYCAQHELDLHMEGEPNDILNQRQLSAAKQYFKLLTGNDYCH